MEQYVKYLRKSRFDRDYAELSVEETLKRHEAILDRLAKDRGYCIAKTYYEVVSGESIAARPEIQKLLDEISTGQYAGVLVVDLERLARGNGADQAYISQVFQFSGTKIITPMKTYDPSNEFDEEYFEFGLFMSRREYKTINRRLLRGRDSSASEGKYIHSIAPYGYEKVKLKDEKGFTLHPHPEEAPVVKKVFELFLQDYGTKRIANYLNDLAVPTRHGEQWNYSTISNMLTNPVYMGKIRRGWSRQVRFIEGGVVKKKIQRQKELENYQIYDGLHPALVSEERFLQAQERRREKQPDARVKKELELQNAFAGLLFCARCGKRMGRTVTSQKRGAVPRLRCVNARSCGNVSAEYDMVEAEIIAALHTWLKGYRVQVQAGGSAAALEAGKHRLDQLSQMLDTLNTQLENAFQLVEQGVYSVELFQSRREKLSAEIADVTEKKQKAEAVLQQLEAGTQSRERLIPQTEALLDSYDRMTNQERNDLLKAILGRIEYQREAGKRMEIDLYPRLPQL